MDSPRHMVTAATEWRLVAHDPVARTASLLLLTAVDACVDVAPDMMFAMDQSLGHWIRQEVIDVEACGDGSLRWPLDRTRRWTRHFKALRRRHTSVPVAPAPVAVTAPRRVVYGFACAVSAAS